MFGGSSLISVRVKYLVRIMMAAGNPSNGRCSATYIYSSPCGLVGKWLYELNEQLCALLTGWVTATVRVLLLVVVLTHPRA